MIIIKGTKMDEILIRHGKPTKLDHASCGKLCKVCGSLTDKYELYIQAGTDESDPLWQYLGEFDQQTDTHEIKRIVENARNYKV